VLVAKQFIFAGFVVFVNPQEAIFEQRVPPVRDYSLHVSQYNT
jgi:hypothetical protein